MEYSLKVKGADGKFVTVANLKRNQYGNLQIGIKANAELRDLVNSMLMADGKWLNLSVYEGDGQKPAPRPTGDAPF